MSLESAKSFMTRLASDDNFRASFEQLETLGERHELAAKSGYEFTIDEWNTLVEENKKESSSEELSEEELEAVAGGACTPVFVAAYGVSPSAINLDGSSPW